MYVKQVKVWMDNWYWSKKFQLYMHERYGARWFHDWKGPWGLRYQFVMLTMNQNGDWFFSRCSNQQQFDDLNFTRIEAQAFLRSGMRELEKLIPRWSFVMKTSQELVFEEAQEVERWLADTLGSREKLWDVSEIFNTEYTFYCKEHAALFKLQYGDLILYQEAT